LTIGDPAESLHSGPVVTSAVCLGGQIPRRHMKPMGSVGSRRSLSAIAGVGRMPAAPENGS
jgi:hypothetical protein